MGGVVSKALLANNGLLDSGQQTIKGVNQRPNLFG